VLIYFNEFGRILLILDRDQGLFDQSHLDSVLSQQGGTLEDQEKEKKMATQTPPVRSEVTTTPHKYANPFSEFRHEMDDLFDKFFHSRPAFDFRLPVTESFFVDTEFKKGMIVPEIDIYEDKKTIKLVAELPGMDENDIELKIREGVLTLSGEKKWDKDWSKDSARVMECKYGKFIRTFTLPTSVNWDDVTAKFKKGVLTVVMPKTVETKWPEKSIKIT